LKNLEGQVLRLDRLEKRIVELERENSMLREVLLRYEKPKNSRNSSIPPSKDENRPKKNQSLRQKSNKKIGGQKGHKGSTLEMTDRPDKIIDHCPEYCGSCAASLSTITSDKMVKRQVVDIPAVIPKYTEHRAYEKTCTCGHKNKGTFPNNVTSPISYGANVMATIGYLNTRQYLPFARMSEFFRDVFNLPISQGTLCNLVSAFAAKAEPAYQLIKQRVAAAGVAGTDETGILINGKIHWFWTWQDALTTFIVFSLNRGGATIRLNFPLGFKKAVLVSDCWSAHFKTPCKTHQLCLAHLLRELNYHEENHNSKWATGFK
jgi:transposase